MSDSVYIREMTEEDIDEVYEIESKTYSTSWSKKILTHEVVENKHAYYVVIEYDDKIVGFAGMWVVFDDAQVTNIAITPPYQGRKLGEKLFRYMLESAVVLGVERLSLEVRVSNIVAQNMYRKFGLVPGGIRKGYYSDNNEDAIVMWVNVT